MRSADEDRKISPQQLRGLMLSASDSIVNMESNNQELTFNQLKALYIGNNLTLRENTFKQNLNLLTRDEIYNLMASILADVNSYSIKVAVFSGTDKTNLIKRNEYGYKCMLVAVKQVLDYMETLNDTVVDVEGSLRKESRLFDFSCFKEAWLNACLHKNSNISVSEISRLIGLGTTTVTKRIHRLKETGIIKRKGSKKTGQWIAKQ